MGDSLSDANQKVLEAIMVGLRASGVSLSAAVFPDVAGAITGFLFNNDYRGSVKDYTRECDAADKANRSKVDSER